MRTVSGPGARGGRPRGKARASACCLRGNGDAGRGLPSGLHQPSGPRAGCKRRSPPAFPWAARCSAPRRCRSGDAQHGGRSRTLGRRGGESQSPAERRAQGGPLVPSAAPIPAAQGFEASPVPSPASGARAARQPVRRGAKHAGKREIQKRAADGLGGLPRPVLQGSGGAPRAPAAIQARGRAPAAIWACAARLPFKWECAPIFCDAVPYRSAF